MTDTALERLTAMWRSGEINDDEFKLATRYLREEQATVRTPPKRDHQTKSQKSVSTPDFPNRLARLLLPRDTLGTLAPWQRHLAEMGLFVIVGGIGIWLTIQLLLIAISADIESSWDLNPIGAAGLTLFVLATGGMLVGYDRRILGVVSLPLFLLLLFAPLWKSPDAPAVTNSSASPAVRARPMGGATDPLRHLFLDEPAYRRIVRANDYGNDWPFPGYNQGTLRCERRTVSGVTRPLVTIEFGGKVYGLNGAAHGWGGYADSRALMAKHPEWGTYELGASGRMISTAVAECH